MIVDMHAHFEPRMLDLDAMIERMDRAGVDRVGLIPTMNDVLPHTPDLLLSVLRRLMRSGVGRPVACCVHRALLTPEGNLRLQGKTYTIYSRPDNASVVNALTRYPDRLFGWMFLNPRQNPRVLDELEELRHTPGMVGIKLHPHWHDYRTEILGPLLARAQELDLPVLIHLGFGKRGAWRAMLDAYPKLRMISAHAGFPFYDSMWRHASKYPNLYVDLSSPYIDEALVRDAVRILGPERCLYGTDAPYGFAADDGAYNYHEIRSWVERLSVTSTERERILGRTAQELLRLG